MTIKEKVEKAKASLEKSFEEDPTKVVALGAVVMSASATLLKAAAGWSNSRTWKKEVARRAANTYKK